MGGATPSLLDIKAIVAFGERGCPDNARPVSGQTSDLSHKTPGFLLS